MDILSILKQIAPWITAAASGSVPGLVAMAAQQIGEAVGATIKPTPDAINAAVMGATPEQIAAIKQADQDFQLKMQALGFGDIETLEKIAADDRADARKREEVVKDTTPRNLAYAITFAFFASLVGLMFVAIPEGNKATIYLMIGSLGTTWLSAITYYFGTTSSSARKTEIIAQSAAA